MKNRFVKFASRLALVLIALVILILIVAYFMLRASLPILDGDIALNKLGAPVTITRDANGTAAIAARNTIDAMRALGFIHAQERFFEMDLTRRAAAGELSALLGAATVEYDKKKRQHRFRHRMNEAWLTFTTEQKNIFTAYAEGVNSGVASLGATHWQYTLLRTTPQPWAEVDSMLVMCEMFYMLQAKSFEDAFVNASLREKMGDALFAWMKPLGGTWDAAMDGSVIAPTALPDASKLNVRLSKTPLTVSHNANPFDFSPLPTSADNNVGSNAWAVDGTLTKTGVGILANDMHLGLSVPNIWFRAEFLIATVDRKKIVGVTLPGVPALVAGSNGHIAWGFTNSYGKWFDWVPVPKDEPVTTQRETIEVKSGNAVALDIRETRFGPILETQSDQQYALNWVAHRPGAINPNIMQMMFAKTIDEATTIAQQSGLPHQNLLVVDAAGKLAWTIAGLMPKQTMQNPQRAGWAKPENITREWLAPSDYPVIKNPKEARLWTANNRQLGGAVDTGGGSKIGEGGFDLGARGQQIRDRLFAPRDKPIDEAALYAIQLDTEAKFIKRWATRMQDVAKQNQILPNAAETSRILTAWNGNADADQAGYLVAKKFRLTVLDQLWKSWVSAATGAETKTSWDQRFEYPAVQALDAKAPHLLPQPFETWDAFLAAQFNAATDDLIKAHGSLDNATWGKSNIAAIRHPISRAVPALGYFLDMPRVPLSGDSNLPKVVAGNFGSSQRIVVSPGHEETAIFTMPGGQSGHPLSPFYGAGNREWMDGVAAPLLTGAPIYTLRLSAP